MFSNIVCIFNLYKFLTDYVKDTRGKYLNIAEKQNVVYLELIEEPRAEEEDSVTDNMTMEVEGM